jgi:transposase InsO family protein
MSHDQTITNPVATAAEPAPPSSDTVELPARRVRSRTRRTVPVAEAGAQPQLTPAQRLLVLDTWMKSGLPAGDFAPLVGVSKHTLYAWKARFEAEGPAGLADQPRGGPRGSRLDDIAKRAILLMKQQHPDWGVDRIAAMLERGPGLAASPNAVLRVLTEGGYQVEHQPTAPHPDKVRHFERARPNQLWQTDLFTFMLKRQNQRVHLVGFLDDHSRFIVSYGLHASQSTPLVLEVFRAGIASYGAPEEVLTDNGTQYVTWRGTSRFAHECAARGVKHIVATPRHPETLGKTERFWGTLWRECLEAAVFADLGEARLRIGHFVDHYNFQRPHQGIGNAVPADRYFSSAPQVRQALAERVAGNALELARNGVPKAPFYLTGNVAGEVFSVHAEGETVVLQKGDRRTTIALDPRPAPVLPEPLPSPVVAPAATSVAPEPPPPAPAAMAVTAAPPMPAPAPDRMPASPPPVTFSYAVPPLPTHSVPVASAGVVMSPWQGAALQPPGVSPIDRIQRLVAGLPAAALRDHPYQDEENDL